MSRRVNFTLNETALAELWQAMHSSPHAEVRQRAMRFGRWEWDITLRKWRRW